MHLAVIHSHARCVCCQSILATIAGVKDCNALAQQLFKAKSKMANRCLVALTGSVHCYHCLTWFVLLC